MERYIAEIAVPPTKVVTYDTINNKSSVDLPRRGEHLAAGQITPLLCADNAAGFKPAICWIEIGSEICAGSRSSGDSSCVGNDTEDLLTDRVHACVVCPHAEHHDLRVDVHHVSVADLAGVDHFGHLHARL